MNDRSYTMTADQPPRRPEIRATDYTSWLIDPLKAKAREKYDDYAAQVAPGADREHIKTISKPWIAIASVALAAGAAHSAMEATGDDYRVLLATAVIAFAVAVVLGYVAKRRLLCVKRRTRVYAFLAGSAAWITAAAVVGVTAQMLWVFVVYGVLTCLWYWADHRLGYGWGIQKQTEQAQAPREDVYAPLWDANLGGRGGLLAGTRLTNWEPLKTGSRYTLEVVAGRHTLREIEMYLPRIKSGLGLKQNHQVLVEEHPELPAPTLLLTIIDRSQVVTSTGWPGASAMQEDGTLSIGPYLDGNGTAFWKLYSANRIHNGFVAGGTGSGKSRLLENIAMTAAINELFPTAVWFADGQDGASSPMLMRHADYYAGKPEQIVAMLREAVEVIKVQQDENKALGRQGFSPTAERPGLLIILDEAKLVLDAKNNPEHYEDSQQLVARIATTGNKAGVGIILAGQEATLPTFGGVGQFPSAIRSNLQTGNAVLLRTKQSAASNIFGVDPMLIRQLPEGGGYGYVAGREGSRKASMRGFYDDDATMARNMGSFTWRSVSELTALDLTIAYRDRKQSADEDLEAAKARYHERLRRLAAGEIIREDFPDLVAPAKPESAMARHTAELDEAIKDLEEFRFTGGQDKVLQAVQSGCSNHKEISEVTGLKTAQVYKYLAELVKLNRVKQESHGSWTAV